MPRCYVRHADLFPDIGTVYTVLAQDDTPSSPEASSEIGGLFEVDGRQLYLVCFGAGSSTVVIDAGQGGSRPAMGQLRKELAKDNWPAFTIAPVRDQAIRLPQRPVPQRRSSPTCKRF